MNKMFVTNKQRSNLLHRVNPGDPNDIVKIITEMRGGSNVKTELDKEDNIIKIDRLLSCRLTKAALAYGFFPQTWYYDEDPLDAYIINPHFPYHTNIELPLRARAKVKIIGAIRALDCGKQDDKIITYFPEDFVGGYKLRNITIDHVYKQCQKIIEYLETYKIPEGKIVQVQEVVGRKEAIEIFYDSRRLYKQKFSI